MNFPKYDDKTMLIGQERPIFSLSRRPAGEQDGALREREK
jgi:hypothetical protein